jgi:serine/threonine-protein kinase HipA
MDILGEGRMPSKVHLLELAGRNGLKIKWASEVIDRISQVAGTFSGIAKNHAIRKQSINTIAGTIEENRRRMLN